MTELLEHKSQREDQEK